MSTYWFELEIGPVSDLEEAAERLYSRCGDGQLSGDEQGGTILFSREARNATEAILSAIDDSERSGLSVTGAMEDLVTIDDIAEKTDRSAPALDTGRPVNAVLEVFPLRPFIAAVASSCTPGHRCLVGWLMPDSTRATSERSRSMIAPTSASERSRSCRCLRSSKAM
ncbi:MULTISPECIES: hypothetical protein [unclassified Spirillospora]|uniref:hypothetical protein n=1 Tax=unclassified Spirillospora TaxID=2642701 RepID=UPI00371FE5D1